MSDCEWEEVGEEVARAEEQGTTVLFYSRREFVWFGGQHEEQ